MKQCPNCKAKLHDDSIFCFNCMTLIGQRESHMLVDRSIKAHKVKISAAVAAISAAMITGVILFTRLHSGGKPETAAAVSSIETPTSTISTVATTVSTSAKPTSTTTTSKKTTTTSKTTTSKVSSASKKLLPLQIQLQQLLQPLQLLPLLQNSKLILNLRPRLQLLSRFIILPTVRAI